MSKHFDTERTCRINGKSPTWRDRWTAFYRLYRMARQYKGGHHFTTVSECIMVLTNDWRFLRLVDGASDTLESNRFLPVPVRWIRVNRSRYKRMYQNTSKLLKSILAAASTNLDE